jgi:hypothetical protein
MDHYTKEDYIIFTLEFKHLNRDLKKKVALLEAGLYGKPGKKKKVCNDLGLKVIDGGKGTEEQPPFTPQNTS